MGPRKVLDVLSVKEWEPCLERFGHKYQLKLAPRPNFLIPREDFRDAFCIAGGTFGRPLESHGKSLRYCKVLKINA